VLTRSGISRSTIVTLLVVRIFTAGQLFTQEKYWIYFTDKGFPAPPSASLEVGSPLYNEVISELHPHTLVRRAKVLPRNELISEADVPVYKTYIDAVRTAGGIIAQQSRWFNAVSAVMTPAQLQIARSFPFVLKTEPVKSFAHSGPKIFPASNRQSQSESSFDYGASLNQLLAINIVPLHSIGITGDGVLVGMLDTGFRWRVHEALQTRKVIAEYDFIFHDDTTANQAGDNPEQDAHGTMTMSLVGGYKPGMLIGAAYDVSFILGKTEDIRSEKRIEEDNWAAAIEWMERNGVDVVSSSLGYNIFDDGTGYTWVNGDFNGRTSITAKAAVRAAELGVIVCDAMGNEGNGDGVAGTMLTPADADSILSVGAVTFSRELADFSSTGPTNDGRIKPDVVAPGVPGIIFAVPPNGYSQGAEGTSLSTPFVAGSAALLLSARPELTPIQVRDALRNTADTIDAAVYPSVPNNFTGWGQVNAFHAALSFGPIFSNKPVTSVVNQQSVIGTNVVSKFGIKNDSVVFHYALGKSKDFVSLPMLLDSSMYFPSSGRYRVAVPAAKYDTLIQFYVDAVDSSGNWYRSPAPSNLQLWQFHYGVDTLRLSPSLPSKYTLYQNYPNPFNGATTIEFDLPVDEMISLKVYNILGEEVAALVNGKQEAGTKVKAAFEAANFPSGVYFYRLRTPSFESTKKMLILR
jgi:serine protease AprX